MLRAAIRKLRRHDLEEELWAAKSTIEEGAELLEEATRAIAGLAKEPLRPCKVPCPGHLGSRARKLYKRGLRQYDALLAEPEKKPEQEGS